MNAHFSTRLVDPDGRFHDLTARINSSADVSPTGSQMPRLVGLAYASKLYRELPELAGLPEMTQFSHNGDEIAFGTSATRAAPRGCSGSRSTRSGVLGVPCCVSIWDDGYGISVPNEYQHYERRPLGAFSPASGASRGEREGFDLYTVKRLGLPGALRDLSRRGRRSCGRSTCRRSSTSSR